MEKKSLKTSKETVMVENTEERTEEKKTPEIVICADKKEYFRCSMYYMRKFFGLREIILLTLLLGVGLFMLFYFANFLLLILFAVSVLIIMVAAILFFVTARGGYVLDVEKKGVYRQKLEFKEEALVVTNMDKTGTPIFEETHYYDKLDKISVKPKRVYIYAQTSVFYYIVAKKYTPEECDELITFLRSHVPEATFKMKKTYRIFAKRKKLTLEE